MDLRYQAVRARPPRPTQRLKRGRVTRADEVEPPTPLLVVALVLGGGQGATHHRSESFWIALDDGSSVPEGSDSPNPSRLPRLCVKAAGSSYRRCDAGEEGGLLLLEYVSRYQTWQRLLKMPYEPKGAGSDSYPWLPHWSRRAPTTPAPPLPPPHPARPRPRSLKLFPPEYVRILYCTPTGWTPGAKGFAGAACAAASDYHVLVPSEGEWSSLLSGRGSTCPYPQPPAGLAKDHIRVALTAQGVRYAVLAQVGTSEATPAFRLSAPSLEQGSVSGPRLSRGGCWC